MLDPHREDPVLAPQVLLQRGAAEVLAVDKLTKVYANAEDGLAGGIRPV